MSFNLFTNENVFANSRKTVLLIFKHKKSLTEKGF